jgi:hypothetical protein
MSYPTNLPLSELSEFPILPEQIKYLERDGEIYFPVKMSLKKGR